MPSIRCAAFAAAMLLCASAPALAAWPERPVIIIVPAAPGGTTDMATRIIADKLGAKLGQSVVVENRAGAAGIIGTQQLVRAQPDGYTLIMGNIGPNAINYSMYRDLPYKPADFAPITLVISVPNVLVVNAQSPARSAGELIGMLRKDPGKYSFGSSGTGQSPHLSGELFKQRAGVQATHVPYKGAGPAVAALLADQFTFMIDNLPSSLPHIQSGKFRALAVTSAKRVPELPDVPTMAEAGIKDMVVTAWFGLLAPAGTPAPVIDRLSAAAREVLAMPEVQQRFHAMGGQAGGNSPAEFGAYIDQERSRWHDTVQAAGLAPK
ncbi:Bug family tripartite tricarboxylate transporter substrate binding protein [Bordetella petrii]|uniref:Bug family tripartite tricarboxylate transporter substrate binding protein n=1 Tax=Bordetella petrii TaxID=94624 RepID=UPI001A97C98F|nr:tripartite tricarboxylate transporter substrate binding protein [Bordetella petrii]MBO1112724.1 tripartite tricarboxylate transporter substrate binding protein [Bordetella petrii]